LKLAIVTGVVLIVGLSIGGFLLLRSSEPLEPSQALGAPRFVDETEQSGLQHMYTGRSQFFEGGGVAVFDCSDDGDAELFFAGGTSAAALYRNESEQGGALSFTKIGSPELELEAVTGAYPVDIDGDTTTDLVVLRVGENVVFRGLGGCRFERANEMWSIDGGSEWTVGFSATWEDAEEFPTLAFGNYLKLTDLTNETDLCSPNMLLRPRGRAYQSPIALDPAWCTLSVLFSDWNRSGVADLRVTNDRQYNRDGEELLWKTSEDRPAAYTRDEGWKLVRIWGMGIASYDVTGDGLPEVFLTSQGDNKLQTLAEVSDRPTYEDLAIRRGATAHRPYIGDSTLPSTAWHAEFQDANNDGFIDLFIAKGNVDAMPNFTSKDPNNLLLGQADGTFVEGGADAGIVHAGRTRGAALVDLNHDGLLDLVEVNREEHARLWRNVGSGTPREPSSMGGWIDVAIGQSGGYNSNAIGSVIEVRIGEYVMTREVTVGGGHASGQLGRHHFGLGPAERAQVRVIWPDGSVGEWMDMDTGQSETLVRNSG
jgi:hypothetical protein